MDIQIIKTLIETGLPDAEVRVNGDGRHFQAHVISDAFNDKTLLQQHQMVYKTLGDKVGNEIHALSIQTYTREQWQKHRPFNVIADDP